MDPATRSASGVMSMQLFTDADELPMLWTDTVGIKKSLPSMLMRPLPGNKALREHARSIIVAEEKL